MTSQTPARGSLRWVKYCSPTSAPPYGGSTWNGFAYQAFSELTPIYSEALLVFSALLRQICSRPFYGGIMQKSCSLKHLTLAVLLQQVITTMNILKVYKRLISTCSVRLNVNFISRMKILVQNLTPKLDWTMWCNWCNVLIYRPCELCWLDPSVVKVFHIIFCLFSPTMLFEPKLGE